MTVPNVASIVAMATIYQLLTFPSDPFLVFDYFSAAGSLMLHYAMSMNTPVSVLFFPQDVVVDYSRGSCVGCIDAENHEHWWKR